MYYFIIEINKSSAAYLSDERNCPEVFQSYVTLLCNYYYCKINLNKAPIQLI